MKSKIRSVNSPQFYLSEGDVYYNLDDLKNNLAKFVKVGTLKKEFFNNFVEKSLNDGKEIFIYSMDDAFVRCCAI